MAKQSYHRVHKTASGQVYEVIETGSGDYRVLVNSEQWQGLFKSVKAARQAFEHRCSQCNASLHVPCGLCLNSTVCCVCKVRFKLDEE